MNFTQMDALEAMPAESIDTSYIPPLSDAFWKNALPNPFYRPTNTSTTLHIDSDVLM